ncbi:MAG: AraC family transcriptional regulator [Halobacteriovorax sp.]|nr:AraC family transcriptional regulator [Halobacteriovorax sp.]|tara:strand:- start:2825 stop:3772 length:948 start_codon:yes stop_codon:yes gene_type:complete
MNSNSYNEILHYLKLDSVFYSRSTLGGDKWGVDLPAFENTSMFHIVTSGSCVVHINEKYHHLSTGDLVFISRACGHSVKGSEEAKAIDLFSQPVKQISNCYETLELNKDNKDQTTILCGIVRINHPAGTMLINEMPDIIVMRQEEHMFGSMMNEIVRLIAREAAGEFIGGETVITRLSDVLAIQAIRSWIESSDSFKSRWIQAIKDEKIGKALSCLHNEPGKTWTVESLGKEVGMSRTAFSNKFSEIVGDSVLNYLTKWRMNLAGMRIKEGVSVDLEFVENLGYKSESAFRRTFKKIMGKNISEFKNKEDSFQLE